MATHVDRLPLVSSAIINVDQDLDEPWPLEVVGHDGKAHNVTMLLGDLVLYESHSVLHGGWIFVLVFSPYFRPRIFSIALSHAIYSIRNLMQVARSLSRAASWRMSLSILNLLDR